MAAREQTREDSNFLVFFPCDATWFTVSRPKIKYDGKVHCGLECEVQWGGKKNVNNGRIIASGDYLSMKKELNLRKYTVPSEVTMPTQRTTQKAKGKPLKKTAKGKPLANVIARAQAPVDEVETSADEDGNLSSSDQTPASTQAAQVFLARAQDTEAENCTSDQETAFLLDRSEPLEGSLELNTSQENISRRNQVRGSYSPQRFSTPKSGHSILTSPITTQSEKPIITMLNAIYRKLEAISSRQEQFEATMNRKIDTLNRRMCEQIIARKENISIQATVASSVPLQDKSTGPDPNPKATSASSPSLSVSETVAEKEVMFGDVTPQYRLSLDELMEFKKRSSGPGNFAKKLTEHFFQELFGTDNLRLKYNWYGGGLKEKLELDPIRKGVILRYVCSFYPEVKQRSVWREMVVTKINEGLRRPVWKKRKERRANPTQMATQRIETEMQSDTEEVLVETFSSDDMNYTLYDMDRGEMSSVDKK